jgi:hypothetical protein
MPLDTAGTVDATTWAALALVLTLIGAALSFLAWRRRGPAAGLRGLAWSLVPIAAWLTGTLRLAAGILEDVVDWAARLVFSPTVWLGVAVAAVAVALWVVSGMMRTRGIGVRDQPRAARSGRRGAPEVAAGTSPAGSTARKGGSKGGSKGDREDDLDDMADIEAILKRHGI